MKITYLKEWEEFDDINVNTIGDYLEQTLSNDGVKNVMSNDAHNIIYDKFDKEFKDILLSVINDTLHSGGGSRPSTKEGILLDLMTDRHPTSSSPALKYDVDYDELYDCAAKRKNVLTINLPAKLGLSETHASDGNFLGDDYFKSYNKVKYVFRVGDSSMLKTRSILNKIRKKTKLIFKKLFNYDIDINIKLNITDNLSNVSKNNLIYVGESNNLGYELMINLFNNGSLDILLSKVDKLLINSAHLAFITEKRKSNIYNFLNAAKIKNIAVSHNAHIIPNDFVYDIVKLKDDSYDDTINYSESLLPAGINNLLKEYKGVINIRCFLQNSMFKGCIETIFKNSYEFYNFINEHTILNVKPEFIYNGKVSISKNILDYVRLDIVEPIINLLNAKCTNKMKSIVHAADIVFTDEYKKLFKLILKLFKNKNITSIDKKEINKVLLYDINVNDNFTLHITINNSEITDINIK